MTRWKQNAAPGQWAALTTATRQSVETHSFGANAPWAPPPDRRLENGFAHAPERVVVTPEQDRHPAGEAEGRGGQYR